MKTIILGGAIFALGAALYGNAGAGSTQDWLKSLGKQRVRRTTSRQTMVAAVRGVDEPGEVDPAARNFEGVEKMDQRRIPTEKLAHFMAEGKLKAKKGEGQ